MKYIVAACQNMFLSVKNGLVKVDYTYIEVIWMYMAYFIVGVEQLSTSKTTASV